MLSNISISRIATKWKSEPKLKKRVSLWPRSMEVLQCTHAASPAVQMEGQMSSAPLFPAKESQRCRQVLSHPAWRFYTIDSLHVIRSPRASKSLYAQYSYASFCWMTEPPKMGENVEELLLSSKEQTTEIYLMEREWRMLGISLYWPIFPFNSQLPKAVRCTQRSLALRQWPFFWSVKMNHQT